jgi:hypothetical protein
MTEKKTIEEIEEDLVHYFAAAGQGYKYVDDLISSDPELSSISREEAIVRIYESEFGPSEE